MISKRAAYIIVGATTAFYVLLFGAPLSILLFESFKVNTFGSGGAIKPGYTLQNYTTLLEPAYLRYVGDTFLLSFISTLISVALAYPAAYYLVRVAGSRQRQLLFAGLVTLIFVSGLVKVYAVAIAFGPTGLQQPLAALLGMAPYRRGWAEVLVVISMVTSHFPLGVVILLGPLQNISTSLFESAVSLGANRLTAHLRVQVPIALSGLLAAFLLILALGVSSFITPLILGRGQVVFLTNLIYARFSEIADFPAGAAVAVVVFAMSSLVVFGLGNVMRLVIAGRTRGQR